MAPVVLVVSVVLPLLGLFAARWYYGDQGHSPQFPNAPARTSAHFTQPGRPASNDPEIGHRAGRSAGPSGSHDAPS